MKYLDLEPFSAIHQIEIRRGAKLWDLHNTADFMGYEKNEDTSELILSWAYGCDCHAIQGGIVAIKCIGVKRVSISEKDPEVPRTEDSCVEYFYQKDNTSVVFAFRGGQSFEIECETIQWLTNATSGHDA